MKKMLIVEDDQLVGNIYRHKFQMEGFQVEIATDGEAGIKAVSTFRPDIVILDLMLPRLNGVEVLRKIRATPQFQTLPVLVLSNAYLSSLVQEAWKAGANNCLIKASCTPKQLIEVVHKTLGATEGPPPTAAETPARVARAAQALESVSVPLPTQDDTAFQTELRQAFLKSSPEAVNQLRALLQNFIKSEGDSVRLPNLFTFYRKVHSVTSNAAVAGLTAVARMSSALEAFIKNPKVVPLAKPPDLQLILDLALKERVWHRSIEYNMDEIEALNTMIKNYKVTVCTLPPEDQKKMIQVAMKQWDTAAAKDAPSAKAIGILKDFLKKTGSIE